MAVTLFSKCSEEAKNILDNENFGAADFWEGCKLYCFAHYSHCNTSKGHFQVSKMGRVICLLQNKCDVAWGAQFDEAIRQAWGMMEEYIQVRHGKDCTKLRALMEEFEDVKKLCTSKNGCLLFQVVKDDEHGTEHSYKQSLTMQFHTYIFDGVRARLNKAQANLASLAARPNLAQRRKG